MALVLLASSPLLLLAYNYLESLKVLGRSLGELGRGEVLEEGRLSSTTPYSNSKLEKVVLIGLVGLFNLFLGYRVVLTLCYVGSTIINTPFLATISGL